MNYHEAKSNVLGGVMLFAVGTVSLILMFAAVCVIAELLMVLAEMVRSLL